jgi:hypothetical protein
MSAEQFNTAVGATKTAIATTIGLLYGPGAKAFADVLLGHPAMLTQFAAMGEKNEAGTLRGEDYAGLIKIVGDIGIGVAITGGAAISVPIGILWAITGIALMAYQNREEIQAIFDHLAGIEISASAGTLSLMEMEGWVVPSDHIDSNVNTHFKTSQLTASPIVLDLDGDGIEITQHTGAILFDHNADGIGTGTAWAGADDGLLVLDRDGNGLIDSGRELFGNNIGLQRHDQRRDRQRLGWHRRHQRPGWQRHDQHLCRERCGRWW